METQRPQTAKAIWRKMTKVGGMTFPDFKLCYKATGTKIVWHWHKNRQIDQWNRTERPEINPDIHGPLALDKGSAEQKNSLFNSNGGKIKISICKMNLDLCFIPHININ